MIGRGTRLCENLLGVGKNKEYFVIFDHYSNFEFFGENPEGYVPKEQPSLYERLFQARIELALSAKAIENTEIYNNTIELIKMILNHYLKSRLRFKKTQCYLMIF